MCQYCENVSNSVALRPKGKNQNYTGKRSNQRQIKRYKMTIGQEFLQELLLESKVTRKYLEHVPFDKKEFKIAEKSESLGRLAIHLAEIVSWWKSCLEQDSLNFIDFEPRDIQSTKELLSYFDELIEEATETLLNVKDEEFDKEWSMTYGEEILFTLPKKQVARLFCMNHSVHHRAQLGVYLRALDVTVSATYGPSADDEDVILIHKFSPINN